MPHLMNRQLLAILIGLLWTSSLHGQVENEVKKILEKKDFVAFKIYSDNLFSNEKRIISHWESLRDLTTNFQEGVFIFEKSVPDSENPAISSVYTFRVTIIASKTKIAYYELSEKKNKKVGSVWKPYYETIDKFKDSVAYNNLKSEFESIFKTDWDEKDLFVTDVFYGSHCGMVGTDPIQRHQIDNWILNKNKMEILNWLKSTNLEKQIYAIDGLTELRKEGIELTDNELSIMKFVINKKGTIFTCSGGITAQKNIKEVTSKYEL